MNGSPGIDVIVVGTSAGGLQAFSAICENLPGDYPIPILLVQHRLKEHNDLLEEVLQSKSRLIIKQADEKELAKPGIVYTAPPDYHLLVERDKTLSLSSDELVNYSRPSIDVLFESAAMAFGKQVLGIVLTGANADGAKGLLAIKNRGGITLVQNPEEAIFKNMPEAAVKAGAATYILSLKQIAEFLLKLPTHASQKK
ncbi:MAG: chemotaxis protein CheB [Chitinophagales bacterium]